MLGKAYHIFDDCIISLLAHSNSSFHNLSLFLTLPQVAAPESPLYTQVFPVPSHPL